MTTFLIPLTNIPQNFEIALAGINYILTVRWNAAFEGGWEFDLQDSITNDYLVAGIPFTTGANCLEGLDYLGVDGEFVVFTDGDETAVPTLENLGMESNLYFLTDAVDNGG